MLNRIYKAMAGYGKAAGSLVTALLGILVSLSAAALPAVPSGIGGGSSGSGSSTRTPSGIYLRGGMNGWEALSDYEFFYVGSDRQFVYLSGVTIGQGEQFKVADASWGSVDYGSYGVAKIYQGVSEYLENHAGNLSAGEDLVDVDVLFDTINYTFLIDYGLVPEGGSTPSDPDDPSEPEHPGVQAPAAPSIIPESCMFDDSITLTMTGDGSPIYYQVGYYNLYGEGGQYIASSADIDWDKCEWVRYMGPVVLESTAVVRMKAVNDESGESKVVTAEYVYNHPLPVFTPEACDFADSMTVTLTAQEGETIRYTTDGSDPTLENGMTYTAPIEFTVTTTIKAIAIDESGNVSAVASATYRNPRHGIGEDYNPASPGNPSAPEEDTTVRYRLILVSNPTVAGEAYSDYSLVEPGTEVRIYNYNYTGFAFVNWTIEDEVVSNEGSFYYTMPDHDVTVVANYVYDPTSPGNPSPEEQKVMHPVAVRAIPSCGASVGNGFSMEEGTTASVYAYPEAGWGIDYWTVNGEKIETNSSGITVSMDQKALDVAVYLTFNPASPGNPGSNDFNQATGQMIVDDFQPGRLYNAISNALNGSEFSDVGSLIVKGQIDSSDLGCVEYLTNASTIDFSRCGGITMVPSYCFYGDKFANLELPATISEIGEYAFYDCSNLLTLSVYSTVPPTISNRTFSGMGNSSDFTIYVPQSAMELYASAPIWKDMDLMPMISNVYSLRVTLPEEAADGRYKNNSLELVNANTGVKQKYVVSDRLVYTFSNLRSDELFNIYMFSAEGLEIGRIEDVLMPEENMEVTFDYLRPLHSVSARVLTPEGEDVTSDAVVEWLRPLADGSTVYMRKGVTLGEIPEGQNLICRIMPGEKIGATYVTPGNTAFTLTEDNAVCTVTLEPLRSVTLSGVVADADGQPLSGASVAMNQLLNGKYRKSYTGKTDRKGAWSMNVLDAPETFVTYSATECVNRNDTIGAFSKDVDSLDLGTVALRSIVGARINYGFTYRAAGAEEAKNEYDDYQNVSISVYNLTQNRDHKDVSVQYPLLAVLDENIAEGDELLLTAVSKTGAFNPVTTTVKVDGSARGTATFDIVDKGGIEASFSMTDNKGVIALLYGSKGELLKKGSYSEAKVTFSDLNDGDYQLVTMGQSDLMSSVLRLSTFDEIGLEAGKDYLKDTVKVESGKIAKVSNETVPTFDETLFYYTTPSTSFLSNKSNITTGNYLTLRSSIDFKSLYKSGVKNVALVVDLPEDCDLIEESVIQGPNLLPYTYDNKRLTVQLGDNYMTQVRFCVIPTVGGKLYASASVVFDYEGRTITQPIGTATAEIKDLEIMVPSVTASPEFTVSGKALPQSAVQVYDGTELIGTGKSNGYGDFKVACVLDDPANMSTHDISAVIVTPAGNELRSASRSVIFDRNCIKVLSVTMTESNNKVVFDFENPDSQNKYYYYSFGKFTFTIEFNSPEAVKSAILYVHTTSGAVVPLEAVYDSKKNIWFATASFDTQSLPLNVSVDFDYEQAPMVDANVIEDLFVTDVDELVQFAETTKDEVAAIEDAAEAEAEADEAVEKEISEIVGRLEDVAGSASEDLAKLFELIGVNYSATDVDEDKEYTNEEIDALLARGESLLSQEGDEASDDAALMQAINDLLAELANEWKTEESLNIVADEPITFEHEGTTYTCRRATTEELADIDLESMNCETANLTDGSKLKLYHTDEAWIVVDEMSGVVYILTDDTPNAPARMYANGLKNASVIYLEKLKEGFKKIHTNLLSVINDMTEGFRKDIKRLKDLIKDSESTIAEKTGQRAGKGIRLKEVEMQLAEVKAAGKGGYRQFDLTAQQKALEVERRTLLNDIEKITKDISPLKTKVSSLKVKLVTANALLAEVMDYLNLCDGILTMIRFAGEGIADIWRWNSFIDHIFPCIDDVAGATMVQRLSIENRDTALRGYCGAFALAGISTALSAAMKFSGKPAGWFLKLICGVLNGALLETSKAIFNQVKADSHNNLNDRIAQRNRLKCKKDDPYKYPYPTPDNPSAPDNDKKPNPGGGKHHSGNTDTKYGIDPSGYVYEAVPTNRIEGVQATIYYKETKEDMYGDPYEDIVLWNAEEYAQENPLFTDENGMYRWDVPQGLWQVKFEKEGYVTAYSEWLPVPPPQLDVNIAIVQNRQPEVVEARAYEEGIEVGFDKYMDPSTLTPANVYVTAGGELLDGEVFLLNAALADEFATEEDVNASRFASRVRFVPAEPLSTTTGEIRLTVSRNVLSYAGIPMADNYTQVLDVEKEVQAIVADDLQVLYGEQRDLTIFATPFDAAVGRTLHISSSSNMVLSLDKDEAVIDEEGKVVVTVLGELPGTAVLTFTIDDVTATGNCAIEVVTELTEADAPRASRLSGTALYRGSEVELTTMTKDGLIYYTLDGTCPCDENGSRQLYTRPIIVNEDMQIRAYTIVVYEDGVDYSEVAEFNYTIKRTDMDFVMIEGWNWISHGFDSAVSVADFAVDENIHCIVGSNGEAKRDEDGVMSGSLEALHAHESYKVHALTTTQRMRLSEVARDPASAIAVKEGRNWLGYPLTQTMTLEEAFAPTFLEEGDCVIGQSGFAMYDGSEWVGTLSKLTPGLGYMFHGMSDKYVAYNTSALSASASRRGEVAALPVAPWSADIYKYPDVMCMVVTLEDAEGTPVAADDYYVGAFVGQECRGVGRVIGDKLMMSVYGYEGEDIRFHVMAVDDDEELLLLDGMKMSETLVGSLKLPYVLSLRAEDVGMEHIGADTTWKVVVDDQTLRLVGGDLSAVSGFSIFDMDGRKVMSKSGFEASGINVSALGTGVYVALIREGNAYTYLKFAK